mmetsp:Transcript_4343/g.8554  ORF Transcript_4343/g.8554 Transcript_4343/m.8554 type:complete len:98 (-) Transcript_4343:354-647(-)
MTMSILRCNARKTVVRINRHAIRRRGEEKDLVRAQGTTAPDSRSGRSCIREGEVSMEVGWLLKEEGANLTCQNGWGYVYISDWPNFSCMICFIHLFF